VTFRVSDGSLMDSEVVTITVKNTNQAPAPSGVDFTWTVSGTHLNVVGPVGATSITWIWGDGISTLGGRYASHAYLYSSTWTVTMKITAGTGAGKSVSHGVPLNS
jgi:hypothetical protein